jgi:hypothetical protein
MANTAQAGYITPTSFSQSDNLKVNEAKSSGSQQEKINT